MKYFHIIQGLLFKSDQLCIPHTSLREVIIKEAHARGLVDHFGLNKTFHLISKRFFRLRARKNTNNFVKRCVVCQRAKGTTTNDDLYSSLSIPINIWEDLSIDFVVGKLGV